MKMTDQAEHEEIQALLPWYANGTLEGEELSLVEEHLAGCSRCRREAQEQRALAAEIQATAAPAPAPHPVQLNRLLARIEADDERRQRRFRWLPRALRRLLDPGPGSLSPAASRLLVAQAALIVLLAGALVWLGPGAWSGPGAWFGPGEPAAAAGSEPRLRVVFDPRASEQELRAVLHAVGGEMVGGPSPLGVYTVALTGDPGEPVPVVLEYLRQRPSVRFAEAVGTDGDGAPDSELPTDARRDPGERPRR